MMGRPFSVDWRPEDTPEALKAAYKSERDAEIRSRIQGLWLLRSGWRLGAVADVVGVHYRTAQKWLRRYREGGLDEVVSGKRGGRGQQPYLSEAERRGVVEEVSTGRFRTASEIREWIAAVYGVSYTMGGTYSLLDRLGCSPKVPRPVHVKADPQRQESWKRGASPMRSEQRG